MKIAVVTSGGDAPGMNAALRAVVRSACSRGWEALGAADGYDGLIEGDFRPLGPRDVGGILDRGGTILGSARSESFREPESRRRAVAALVRAGAGALVVIGGNGSQQGADALRRLGFPVVGVASTIDNDLVGSEPSLGAETACETAVEALDRLRSTARSFHRLFVVETMGRGCGWLALASGLAGGAELISTPEAPLTAAAISARVRACRKAGRAHGIVVVAEGARPSAAELARALSRDFDVRLTILGHVQRGGRPGAFDRVLGTRLGEAAVESLARGEKGVLAGWLRGAVARTPLAEAAGKIKPADPELLRLAEMMAA